jgi:hypothetical protein
MLFEEIIDAYTENHTQPIYTLCEQNSESRTVDADGAYSYQYGLKS